MLLTTPVSTEHASLVPHVAELVPLRSPEHAFESIGGLSARLGFEYVVFGATGLTQVSYVQSSYPRQWVQYFFDRNSVAAYDRRLCCKPVEWRDLNHPADGCDLKVDALDTRAAEGLELNVVVTAPQTDGTVGIMSFAAGQPVRLTRGIVAHLHALATIFANIKSRNQRTLPLNFEDCELTDREKECLSWVAQGKSSWDIGVILSVSENTINFHLKNALRKLDTNSRTLAVVRAIKKGIIKI